jgi:hypothetical protein
MAKGQIVVLRIRLFYGWFDYFLVSEWRIASTPPILVVAVFAARVETRWFYYCHVLWGLKTLKSCSDVGAGEAGDGNPVRSVDHATANSES